MSSQNHPPLPHLFSCLDNAPTYPVLNRNNLYLDVLSLFILLAWITSHDIPPCHIFKVARFCIFKASFHPFEFLVESPATNPDILLLSPTHSPPQICNLILGTQNTIPVTSRIYIVTLAFFTPPSPLLILIARTRVTHGCIAHVVVSRNMKSWSETNCLPWFPANPTPHLPPRLNRYFSSEHQHRFQNATPQPRILTQRPQAHSIALCLAYTNMKSALQMHTGKPPSRPTPKHINKQTKREKWNKHTNWQKRTHNLTSFPQCKANIQHSFW